MPIYVYIDCITGKEVELRKSVEDRDKVPANLKRVTAPQRLTVFGTSSDKIEPNTVFSSVPKAFKEYENTSGLSTKGIEAKVGFSRDHIRRVFNFLVLAVALLAVSARGADITPGYNFLVNDTVTAAKLNSAAAGSIKTSFIHGQTFYQPGPADELIFYASSIGNVYRRSSLDVAVLSNTNMIAGRTELFGGLTNDLLVLDYTADSLKRISLNSIASGSLLTITNLPIITAPTNGDIFPVFNSSNGVMKQVTALSLSNYFVKTVRFSTNNIAFPTNTATAFSATHGLGAVPQTVRWTMVCTNVAGEGGYSQNDEIDAVNVFDSTRGDKWIATGANATTMYASWPQAVSAKPTYFRKDTAADVTMNPINWNLKCVALYFP